MLLKLLIVACERSLLEERYDTLSLLVIQNYSEPEKIIGPHVWQIIAWR